MPVHRRVPALALVALVAATACGPRYPAAASTSIPPVGARHPASGTFVLLHTNDIHGRLWEFAVDTGNASAQTGDPGRSFQQYERPGVVGGFARLAGAVEAIRAQRGRDHVLLVDAGDTFGDQLLSNLTRGEAAVRAMDALGYDFMALGNHDYEYGADNTRRLQGLVHFPMRAANAVVRATGEPFLGDPTRVVTVNGIRVGLLALTYHNTDQTGNRDNTRELAFTSGIDAARRYVPRLRSRADVVVVVSHQGTKVDSMMATRVPGIDVIISGHSHDRVSPPMHVGDAWLVEALSDASALGELTVTVHGGRVAGVNGTVHELYADAFRPDPRYAAMIDSMRAPYRARLEEVVARTADRIGRRYKSESPVDRLACDILRDHTGAQLCFLPGLGFGITVDPGPITREMLYAWFPHPTAVIREKLTGAQVLRILEQSATNLRPRDPMDRVGGLVQTAGLRFTVDLTRPEGSRIRDVFVGAAPIARDSLYTVVTNGGLLQGTHRYTAFAQGRDVERDALPFDEVLEAGVRRLGVLHAPAMGDVTLITGSTALSDVHRVGERRGPHH